LRGDVCLLRRAAKIYAVLVMNAVIQVFLTYGPGAAMLALLVMVFKLGHKMDKGFTNVENEFKLVRSEMSQGLKDVRAEMKEGFLKVYSVMDKRFNETNSEMDKRFNEVDKRLNETNYEMKEGFLKINHRLEHHDREIKRVKKKLNSPKRNDPDKK